MGNTFAKAAAIDFVIQWILWAIASYFKTEKFHDLAGSGTFLFLAYQRLQWDQTYFTRQKATTGLAMTWAARIGLFRFVQGLKDGEDSRLKGVKDKPMRFWFSWTMQGIWVFVTLLPLLVLNNREEDCPLTTWDYVGWGLWGLGFVFETVADYQKSVFKSNPDNAGKFITSGLWSISRSPAYFGELCMWLGILITSSSVVTSFKENVLVISPLFLSFLLLLAQEKQQETQYGTDPNFANYVKQTARLLPYVW